MAQPYSTTANVLGPALRTLITSAGWNVTEGTGDVAALIQEGDNEIDARLAGLEVALPFASNPGIINNLSVLRARYACFRELYSAGKPTADNPRAQKYKDQYEELWMHLEEGWAKLVASDGSVVAMNKFATVTVNYPCPPGGGGVDAYPNYPSGPYPDPPGIGYPEC